LALKGDGHVSTQISFLFAGNVTPTCFGDSSGHAQGCALRTVDTSRYYVTFVISRCIRPKFILNYFQLGSDFIAGQSLWGK